MDIKYIINGLIIATLAIVIQSYFFSMVNVGNAYSVLYVQYATLQAQLQNSSLSDFCEIKQHYKHNFRIHLWAILRDQA